MNSRAVVRRLLVSGALAAILVRCAPRDTSVVLHGTPLPATSAPDLVLTDQHGRSFDLARLHGDVVILFFGYTHCPDVCPTTLAELVRMRRLLDAATRAKTTIAFVTVDPARDDPARLRAYLGLFDPSIVGLTGDPRSVDRVLDAYHVWHQRLPGRAGGGYAMAHGSNTYLIDPAGRLRTIHDFGDREADIAADVKILAS